jgi:putative ABC transport system permease protein
MQPSDRDLDDEIRGHLALSIKERIDRGEDPAAARRAALAEFGSMMRTRDEMREVWHSRPLEWIANLRRDVVVAIRSLRQAKGLALTVVVTLALGIGANAAIFSVVREVLLRPLVNRDQDRLIYIRQGAPGLNAANLTFSVPEIDDFKARIKSISAFGDFSTIEFTVVGFGEPRVVQAGVVSGSFFDVMGLRPSHGRLINAADDGPNAPSVAVLTHRFWSTTLNGDVSVIGKAIRLGTRTATVIGVLEPSVPYPAETEIIANVVTSPHHMSATMVTGRTHRMTELFGRLAPGRTLDDARNELNAVYASMIGEHADAYPASGNYQVSATLLRDQIAAPARTILLILLSAAAVVFVIACSNVANLILARTVRREGELAVRAALGASRSALRRTLLGESLVLCGAGAVLGILLARPAVAVVGSYAARFSVRAHNVTVDASLVWIGAALAMIAAVSLAYIPRLPSAQSPSPSSSGVRITPGTSRRLRLFAVTQVALTFVMLVGAGMLLTTLVSLQRAATGYNINQVLVLDVPAALEAMGAKGIARYQQMMDRTAALPGVQRVAVGNMVPWRDAGRFGPASPFAIEDYTPADGEESPRARFRIVSPGYFDALGVALLAGRDFHADDRIGAENVVIVSQSVAQRLFPNGEAINRRMWWTDPFFGGKVLRRIVGVVADADDERIVPGPAPAIYMPFRQAPFASRMFVQTAGDPYSLIQPVTRIIHEIAADQPVERAATLADVRAQVLAPERLNAFVLSGFGGVALLIAVVGIAGVLAFSVSARTREFGVRLAVGATPTRLLLRVLSEGARMVAVGITAGVIGGYLLARIAGFYVGQMQLPGLVPIAGAALVLGGAAIAAALMPAARASRVDVLNALRSE